MFQALLAFAFLATAYGQQAGNLTTETHPKMAWSKCSSGGSCTNQSGTVVLDSNWRWLHYTKNYTNCYTGNEWDSSACPDPAGCAKNCALDGADYSGTYGITTSSNSLKMVFVTEGEYSTNIGSRVYMLASDTKYMMYKLLNQEFTFTVDVSNLPCGLNGALYFVEMDEDGGMSKYSANKAGAKFGTGYCDAQCPHDIKFINGEGNMQDWTPSDSDKNAGSGKYGTCCTEMDIWEANSMGAAYTPHPCTSNGQTRCDGTNCGDADERHDGYCDKDGCDYSHYRLGDHSYYGKGKTVDSTKPFTVVTQFITDTGTDSGTLKEIRRLYVQNGKVIQNSKVNMPGVPEYDSITDQFCADYKVPIGDPDTFKAKGGMKKMSDVMKKGMVLVMSIWDDHAAHMLWLDSNYPTDKDASVPGVARGECPTDSGDPADIEEQSPKASVTYSDIRVGPLNSTYKAK